MTFTSYCRSNAQREEKLRCLRATIAFSLFPGEENLDLVEGVQRRLARVTPLFGDGSVQRKEAIDALILLLRSGMTRSKSRPS